MRVRSKAHELFGTQRFDTLLEKSEYKYSDLSQGEKKFTYYNTNKTKNFTGRIDELTIDLLDVTLLGGVTPFHILLTDFPVNVPSDPRSGGLLSRIFSSPSTPNLCMVVELSEIEKQKKTNHDKWLHADLQNTPGQQHPREYLKSLLLTCFKMLIEKFMRDRESHSILVKLLATPSGENGDTVLHLALNHLLVFTELLKVIKTLGKSHEEYLLNQRNAKGETIFHAAITGKKWKSFLELCRSYQFNPVSLERPAEAKEGKEERKEVPVEGAPDAVSTLLLHSDVPSFALLLDAENNNAFHSVFQIELDYANRITALKTLLTTLKPSEKMVALSAANSRGNLPVHDAALHEDAESILVTTLLQDVTEEQKRSLMRKKNAEGQIVLDVLLSNKAVFLVSLRKWVAATSPEDIFKYVLNAAHYKKLQDFSLIPRQTKLLLLLNYLLEKVKEQAENKVKPKNYLEKEKDFFDNFIVPLQQNNWKLKGALFKTSGKEYIALRRDLESEERLFTVDDLEKAVNYFMNSKKELNSQQRAFLNRVTPPPVPDAASLPSVLSNSLLKPPPLPHSPRGPSAPENILTSTVMPS